MQKDFIPGKSKSKAAMPWKLSTFCIIMYAICGRGLKGARAGIRDGAAPDSTPWLLDCSDGLKPKFYAFQKEMLRCCGLSSIENRESRCPQTNARLNEERIYS